jgi:hypothetical protein
MAMRRLGFFGAAALLALTLAAPASAAERVRESGTFYSFFSGSFVCSGNTCTDTFVDAFSIGNDTLLVCFNEFTFNARTGRHISSQGGCTETGDSALNISNNFTVTLAPTDVTLSSCNQRRCTEGDTVTVSATDEAIGPIGTATGRVTIKDGTCTIKISFRDSFAEVAGTMTIDGVTIDQQGFASVSEQTMTTTCR